MDKSSTVFLRKKSCYSALKPVTISEWLCKTYSGKSKCWIATLPKKEICLKS